MRLYVAVSSCVCALARRKVRFLSCNKTGLHYNYDMKRNFKTALFLLSAQLLVHCFFISPAFSQSRPIASNVTATAKNENEILVTWDLTVQDGVTSIAIFRANAPIAVSQDLAELAERAEVESSAHSFTDRIEDKTAEYFYAVIARTAGKLYRVVVPSVNATVIACVLPEAEKTETLIEPESEAEKLYVAGSLREQPLPYMKKSIRTPNQSDSAAESVKNMFPLAPKTVEKGLSPYVFAKDREEGATGDDYLLQVILKRTFLNADYKKAAEELVQFLSANREENASRRAEFYIGECYYFSGDYKRALEYFLKTQNDFVPLCRKWTRYTLNAYEIPKK